MLNGSVLPPYQGVTLPDFLAYLEEKKARQKCKFHLELPERKWTLPYLPRFHAGWCACGAWCLWNSMALTQARWFKGILCL